MSNKLYFTNVYRIIYEIVHLNVRKYKHLIFQELNNQEYLYDFFKKCHLKDDDRVQVFL